MLIRNGQKNQDLMSAYYRMSVGSIHGTGKKKKKKKGPCFKSYTEKCRARILI